MDKSTDKIKMRGGKIKKVRDFMFLSGFSGNFMDSEVFWCVAKAVYQVFFVRGQGFILVRWGRRPSRTKIKPWPRTKKNLINCWGNTSEHRSCHEIPRKAWWQHKKTNCLILLHLLFILAVDLSICNFIVFFKKFFFQKNSKLLALKTWTAGTTLPCKTCVAVCMVLKALKFFFIWWFWATPTFS